MSDDAGNHKEQQRELEEIRRSFRDIGIRMGSLFEPEHNADDGSDQRALPAPASTVQPAPAKNRPAWVLAVALVACLLIGGGLGFLLHRPAADTDTARPTPTSIVVQTVREPQVKVVAPPACLQTAQRGDELIDLFTRNIRDRRLSLALKAYTLASQACRKEASP